MKYSLLAWLKSRPCIITPAFGNDFSYTMHSSIEYVISFTV